MSWIKLLYTNSHARILTDQMISTVPHLGYIGACEYTSNKISLYTDDILTYVAQPQFSVPVLDYCLIQFFFMPVWQKWNMLKLANTFTNLGV